MSAYVNYIDYIILFFFLAGTLLGFILGNANSTNK